jgi:two-component system response regulator YesN
LVGRQRPAIALVDVRMPGMSGLEMIRRLREANVKTKFIILSGYGDFEYTKQAILLGVDAYLLKPVDEQELAVAVKNLRRKIAEEAVTEHYIHLGRDNLCVRATLGKIDALAAEACGGGTARQVERYVEENYPKHLTLDLLGVLFGYNSLYLGRVFKQHTGVSFNEYLERARVDAAKALLEAGAKIGKVAEATGFANEAYFCARFKKRTGVRPAEYRAQCLKKENAKNEPF